MTWRGWPVALLAAACAGPALPQGSQAETCGGCHTAQFDAWRASPHARSATSPVFQALLAPVARAWGEPARARCVACHQPGHGEDDAIGCVSCHAAVGNRGEANGALLVDLDAPLAGPSPHPRDLPAHRTVRRGFLSTAGLCGTCHEVHGPGLLDEPTLTEFRASPFSASDSCAPCHADHGFGGIDPPWDAAPADAARAAEASRALLARGLRLEVGADGAVRLRNEGAGHSVPTGIAALRDVWVDVALTDAAGVRVQLPRVLELGARPMRGGVEVALPTDADRIAPRALAPGEERVWQSAPGSTEIRATLNARAFRREALAALGLSARADEVPLLQVAVAVQP